MPKFPQLERGGVGVATLYQIPSVFQGQGREGAPAALFLQHRLPKAGCDVAPRVGGIYAQAWRIPTTSMQGFVQFVTVVNLKEKVKSKAIMFTWAT